MGAARNTPVVAATIDTTDDPAAVLERAHAFLASDPVAHNLVATLLVGRATVAPEPGRYWIVEDGSAVVGIALQSPLDFFVTVTPLPVPAVPVLVDAIASAGGTVPGVSGEAGTVARVAGAWTERTRSAARPAVGQRIYEVGELVPPARSAAGHARVARGGERDLLVRWTYAFGDEVGERVSRPEAIVDRRLPAGQLHVWDDGAPVSFAGVSTPVHGVARIGPVYTPPDGRGQGYASALVASLSAEVLGRGDRCILYTDVANPTSNAIYRALGYRATIEVLRYDLG